MDLKNLYLNFIFILKAAADKSREFNKDNIQADYSQMFFAPPTPAAVLPTTADDSDDDMKREEEGNANFEKLMEEFTSLKELPVDGQKAIVDFFKSAPLADIIIVDDLVYKHTVLSNATYINAQSLIQLVSLKNGFDAPIFNFLCFTLLEYT